MAQAFLAAHSYPELVPVADVRNEAAAEQFAEEATAFALSREADGVGIAPVDPRYVFEGYTSNEPWVIVLALAHVYERLKHVPSDETNGVGVTDIADQYARGTRASYALANWIRKQGYNASAYPGPAANALLLIPVAIAYGLGELGKDGSLISRQFGSGLRLAGVTTDMPLVATTPARFGADEFCMTCQVCTRACPPDAIADHKKMVRGVERWYVDFDKCIAYLVARCMVRATKARDSWPSRSRRKGWGGFEYRGCYSGCSRLPPEVQRAAALRPDRRRVSVLPRKRPARVRAARSEIFPSARSRFSRQS